MAMWFTADTHFHHDFIRKILKRPFSSVEEMDEVLIENWNKAVKPGDEIYHLGDFIFGPQKSQKEVKKYRSKLNGKLHIIMGGHDYSYKIQKLPQLFSSISNIKIIKYYKKRITLCHYSMRVWPASHYNSYHLFGHSHGALESFGKSFDIGVDCWNYKPVHIDEVLEKFEKLPDNFNLIKKREV